MRRSISVTGLCAIVLLCSTHSHAQIFPQGKYLILNGIDQFMTIYNDSGLNIPAGGSLTLTFRMNQEHFEHTSSILSKANHMVPGGKYEFEMLARTQSPNLNLYLSNEDNTTLGNRMVATLSAGQWVHVAWVLNATDKSSSIFINGIRISKTINQAIGRKKIENNLDLLVGCSLNDAASPVHYQFWPGQFDELRIWKRALSDAEVMADRSATRADTTALVAAYDFEQVEGRIVPDVSGHKRNGVLSGYEARAFQTTLPVGPGNRDERLTGFRVVAPSPAPSIKSITINLGISTNLYDLRVVNIYYNGSSRRLNLRTARLFATFVPIQSKNEVTGNLPLSPGENYFWITADISPAAVEGNCIGAKLISCTLSDNTTVSIPDPGSSRTLLLAHQLLFSGGDGGSRNYRIPAIVTARDGSLVTATDKRWEGPYDLPHHIDVVIRRSTDNGSTWSDPLTIAGEGTLTGFGDPALVLNRRNGEIICLFASGRGFFFSTPLNPIRIYQSISTDNGLTWSQPADITPQIYGPQSPNPLTQSWQAAFVTSGSAIQLRSGRLMAVMPVRETTERAISNFVIYSDDNARTWKVAPGRAISDGNEAKLVELDNRRLLMSIRSTGARLFNTSSDRGMTWGTPWEQPSILDPNCNGDMIRYTQTSLGYEKNRILHSIPYSTTRNNLSVLVSYDEGTTWPVRKMIYSGPSAYSSLCILPDGTIGLYYECGEYEIYQMCFARFSLTWLSDGADTWKPRYHSLLDSETGPDASPDPYTVYPNPAREYIRIQGNLSTNTRIELYDSRGNLLKWETIRYPADQAELSLADVPAGYCFLRIAISGRVVQTFPIMKISE